MNVIPNLSKACQVLRALSGEENGLSLAELATRLKIPRTTAFRILNTFCAENLVAKEQDRYFSGSELARIGLLTLSRMEIREMSRPFLLRLSRSTGETAHLAMLSGDKALILEVCESPFPIRAASRPGTLADLHASSTGKVLLASMASEERVVLLESLFLKQRTPKTLTTISALKKEIDSVSKNGFAVDDEEYHPGVRCLAAPVLNQSGRVIAAVGITGAAERFGMDRVSEVAREVTVVAGELSKAMGFSKAA